MNTASSLYQELTPEELLRVVEEALHTRQLHEARLLDGGLFNTTYKICYGPDREEAVLRLGPVNRHLILAFEEELMKAEDWIYRLCREHGIPCSDVLACNTQRKAIDRDYMIVRYIPSTAMSSVKLEEDERCRLRQEVGRIARELHSITSPDFGRVSLTVSGRRFSGWYDYLLTEVTDITERSRKFQVFTEEEISRIRAVLPKHRELLEQIQEAHLIHTDLWEGNVLLKEENGVYQVAAVIDADRAVFGDLDFEFATPWMTDENFYKGYGPGYDPETFHSPQRETRRKIYWLVYCLVDAYVGAAEYNNPDLVQEKRGEILRLLGELE